MRLLYIDNFRGFSDQVVPLSGVNFLVGENSTGKSSLMHLIHLFSNPSFQLYQDFSLELTDLATFEDFVSRFSDEQRMFVVGYYDERMINEKHSSILFIAKCVSKKSLPSIKEFQYIYGDDIVHVIVQPKSFKYKINNMTNKFKEFEPSELIRECAQAFKKPKKGFKQVNLKHSHAPQSIPIIRSVLTSINQKSSGVDIKNFFFDGLSLLYDHITWVAPIRSKPKGTYTGLRGSYSSEGDHVPYMLKSLLSSSSKQSKKFKEDLQIFGKESGMFEKVHIKNYGKKAGSPFELNVLLDGKEFKVSNVGYGVSQVLPVVSESLFARPGTCMLIQQPEVHLHPRAQAEMGEMFHSLSSGSKIQFVVETHSDFVIDRFRIKQKQSSESKQSCQVLFFERTKNGNNVHAIPIDGNGSYPEDQPESFRDFFIHEQMSLLGM